MPPAPADPALVAEARRLRAQGLTTRDIAKRLRMSQGWVSNSTRDGGPGAEPAAETGGFEEKADGTATATAVTSEVVRTLDDAVRVAGVDLAVWYVERWESTAWTVGMKVRQPGGVDGTRQEQQYRVKLYLRRILPRALADAMAAVFERLKDAAPRWPKIDREKPTKTEPFLAVFGLFDVHFGKLAWAPETGEHYDLRIAEAMFRNAVEDLIAESRHRPISKILLPFGNDFLHVDSRLNETTRGTRQDVDGRFSKVLAAATHAVLAAVETMAAVAPVQVELVPGNHDRTLSECLCHVIAARFHHTDRVTVNSAPATRKYVRFGTNLIGLAHGDLVKPEHLPGLMPADAKREWADTTCHEWLTGHGHRTQKWTAKDTDTQAGVVVRQLRALTRTDLWHYDHGYVGGHTPGAEVYFYGRDRGYAGHAVVPARVA